MTVDELLDFINNKVQMQHIYQPLVIRALVDAGGVASLRSLALALLHEDEALIASAMSRN